MVFTAGCTFRCPSCHNRDLVLHPDALPDVPLTSVLSSIGARRTWIDGVTITGGEPTLRPDLPELLSLFRETGAGIKLDTNGSRPDVLEHLIVQGLLDAVFMDVKAPLTDAEYSRAAGVPVDVRLIRRSIDILKSSALEIVFRTTVIPGIMEEPEIERIATALGDVPRYLLQAFRNRDTLSPAFASVPEILPERMEYLRCRYEIAGSGSRPIFPRSAIASQP